MRFLFALVVVLIASPAWADATGGDLNAACNSAAGTMGDKLCNAYINGFINGVLGDQYERDRGTPICLPEHINPAKIRTLVTKFFLNNPQTMPFMAGASVGVVVERAYPCNPN